MHDEIVKKIKYLRKIKDLTSLDMANKLNIDLSAYHRLESGKTFTWAKYLDEILKIFEISTLDFFNAIPNETKVMNDNTSKNIDNYHMDLFLENNQKNIIRLEKLYEDRLKDKDEIINFLKNIIEDLKS